MSLHPQPIPPVPKDTARVARAAFPKGNIYVQIRDTLGSIYKDSDFAELFSVKGQPAQSPWRLALICVMQYMENLSDRQAADAVRGRIDWKYALSLPLEDSGFNLLKKIYAPNAPEWLRYLPAVEILRQVWVQQFYAPVDGQVEWRSPSDMPPSTIAIHSPYDVEAHYSSKRSVNWVGYKAHVTEICDEDSPHFITHVHTTLSTVTDETVVEPIHQALSEKSLKPEEHLMDLGYVTAGHLVSSQENYGIELIGPVRSDPSWQTKHHPKFASSNFQIDWEKQIAICPKGHQSQTWSKKTDKKGQPVINIRFSQSNCGVCASRSRCTRAKTEPRGLTIHTQFEHTALQNRREVQNTPQFLKTYNQRAGIEGTISQGVRRSALRQSRYLGLAKTHLQHIFMAAGLNLCRLDDWLNGIPLAPTRYSRFLTLKPKTS